MERSLIEVDGLKIHFPARSGFMQKRHGSIRAVDGVDLQIGSGETLGLVGESGSGKTTLGRCVVRLLQPTAGKVLFRGTDLSSLGKVELRRLRRHFQMVFQDPASSLNPKMRIRALLAEPLAVHNVVPRQQRPDEVHRLLAEVGLPADVGMRFPSELSVGQQQRVGIARALASRPEFIVADEPVSALDASVQAQIINLLINLRATRQLAVLFIGHDLAVVERISDRVGVFYLGKIVEIGEPQEVFGKPLHPYSVALRSAVPLVEPRSGRLRIVLPGEPPSALSPPPGCGFHPRCPIASARCAAEAPELVELAAGHRVACHYPGTMDLPA